MELPISFIGNITKGLSEYQKCMHQIIKKRSWKDISYNRELESIISDLLGMDDTSTEVDLTQYMNPVINKDMIDEIGRRKSEMDKLHANDQKRPGAGGSGTKFRKVNPGGGESKLDSKHNKPDATSYTFERDELLVILLGIKEECLKEDDVIMANIEHKVSILRTLYRNLEDLTDDYSTRKDYLDSVEDLKVNTDTLIPSTMTSINESLKLITGQENKGMTTAMDELISRVKEVSADRMATSIKNEQEVIMRDVRAIVKLVKEFKLEGNCVFCSNPVKRVLLPCSHVLCEACLAKSKVVCMIGVETRCPMCLEVVRDIKSLFV